MSRSQRRLTIGFAAVGALLVVGASACVAYAFGPRTGLEFWLLAVPLALTPYAVVTVALGTAGASRWAHGVVVLAGLTVLFAGVGLLRDVLGEAQVRSTINFTRDLWHLSWAATDWLCVQGIAAIVAAFCSGLTGERRPRHGLWFLFTAGSLAFAVLVDFDEQLGRSVVPEFPRAVRALTAGEVYWGRYGTAEP
jgi:hypothetical protein